MTKMVIVIRKDLNMRKGKIAAQAAHAASGILLDLMGCETNDESDEYTMSMKIKKDSPLAHWLNGSFTKICVSVNSEEVLENLCESAREKGLLCHLVTDSGFTEFHGVPTKTCLAIGPAKSEEIDAITGTLPLL